MTTTKSFYAFYNTYGTDTISTSGDRIGMLYRFDTKRERDAWVDDEDYRNGNTHRESLTAAEARREMAHELAGPTSWMSMGELWIAYDLEVNHDIDISYAF